MVPRVIAGAGDAAARRFLEFFAATIRNKNTRMAYYRAAELFFAWCDRHRIGELADIEPLHVAAYIKKLQETMAKPTVKQHLATTWRPISMPISRRLAHVTIKGAPSSAQPTDAPARSPASARAVSMPSAWFNGARRRLA